MNSKYTYILKRKMECGLPCLPQGDSPLDNITRVERKIVREKSYCSLKAALLKVIYL
jgi:hypothetical protein